MSQRDRLRRLCSGLPPMMSGVAERVASREEALVLARASHQDVHEACRLVSDALRHDSVLAAGLSWR